MSPLALAALACLGLALTILGQLIGRSAGDPVAKRLRQFSAAPRSLEELEMQQPLSERALRPLIRRLASLAGRIRMSRTKSSDVDAARDQGVQAIRNKLTMAGNPY